MADNWAYAFSLELKDNDTVALGNGGENGNGGNFSGNTIDITTGNEFHFGAAYGETQEAMYCAPESPEPPPYSVSLHLEDNDVVALGNGGANGNGGNFTDNTITIDTGNDFHFG
jgi:hypothetical protein